MTRAEPRNVLPSPLWGGVEGGGAAACRRGKLSHAHIQLLPTRGRRAAYLIAALAFATPALADDKADCATGIATIQTEIGKAPPEPVLAKLRKALKVAEREQKEGEFDECLDAVGDAKRAVK